MKTNRLGKKSQRMRWVGTIVLLGLAALGGTAIPALCQEMVQGKFTLPVEARLGNTVLPAGEYKFSVVPLGNIRLADSIQVVSSYVQVVVRGTAKRAAGTDAGVMGRDASVWSGSWSFFSGCGCGRGIDPDKHDFIRAWLLDRKANANATANTTASATAGSFDKLRAGSSNCAVGTMRERLRSG